MKHFYKIVDGLLQSGQGTKTPEGFSEDWSIVQTKEDGSYATYYNEDGTINTAKETELAIETARTAVNNAIQTMLDSKAQEYRYDNMMSVRSYAGYANPFQVEAQGMAIWASNCWVKAGQIEAEVVAGTRPILTVDEVLAEMPIYEG